MFGSKTGAERTFYVLSAKLKVLGHYLMFENTEWIFFDIGYTLINEDAVWKYSNCKILFGNPNFYNRFIIQYASVY